MNCLREKLDGDYTRILPADLNSSWKQQVQNSYMAIYLPSFKLSMQDMLDIVGEASTNS